MERAQQLQEQIAYYQHSQQQLLGDLQRGLYEASHVRGRCRLSAVLLIQPFAELWPCCVLQGQHQPTDTSVAAIRGQIQTLGLLSHTRSYGEITSAVCVQKMPAGLKVRLVS